MQWFSMQTAMNNCFILNPDKNFYTNPSCRFRKNAKTA